jgi:CubicO group peptidase (beta-lactamase class C family)
MLIERLTGKSLEEFVNEQVFIPLAMNSTGLINYEKLVPERTSRYHWQNGVFTNTEQLSPVIEFSDGGLASTIGDLEKWMIGLASGKMLQPATRELCGATRFWQTERLPCMASGLVLHLTMGKEESGIQAVSLAFRALLVISPMQALLLSCYPTPGTTPIRLEF